MSEVSPAIQKLASLNTQQVAIGSVVIAVMYYMFMYDDGKRLEQSIAASKTSIQQYQTDLEQYAKAEEEAKVFNEALAIEGPKFDAIIKYMPEKLTEFDVMEILSTEAKAAGGRVRSNNAVRATSQDSSQIYKIIQADLNLDITYSQFLQFLSYLTKTDKIIILREFSISKTKEENEGEVLLNINAKFEGYQYNPKEENAGG